MHTDRVRPVRHDRAVRREGELLQADEPGAGVGRDAHALDQRGAVLAGIGVPAMLHERRPAAGPARRRVDPRRRRRHAGQLVMHFEDPLTRAPAG